MFRSKGNKLSRILITVFTALTVIAGFCFAAVEPLRAVRFVAERAGGVGGRLDGFIPSLPGEPALLTKTEELRPVSPRTGLQRVVNPCGTYGIVSIFYQFPLGTSANTSYIDLKNTVPLKLRI
jgi:hypothetical protein